MSGPGPPEIPYQTEWFQKLVEDSQAAVFVYAQGRILYVNPEAVRLCGMPREELLTGKPIDIVHPEDREVFSREESRMRHSGGTRALEFRILRPDRTIRWVTFSVRVIEWEGRRMAIGSAMDITRRVEAERHLRESREWLEMAQWAGRSVAWE